MNEERISVIVPVYNVAQYLPKCMESIRNQTYENLEVILIDDGATDESGAMCDQFKKEDPRIVVFHKENGGLSDARNYGIARATGTYITCIDSDDYVEKDYVEYMYRLLKKYDTRMAICQHMVHYDNGSVKRHGGSGDEKMSGVKVVERMLYHDVIDTSAWAKLYHRDLFRDVQYPFGKLFEDIGTTYALMLQCDLIAVGYEPKYHYIYHANSIVNSAFIPKKLDLLEMTDQMGEVVSRDYPYIQQAVIRRRVYARFSTLNQMLQATDCEEEKEKLIRFILWHRIEVLRNKKAPRRDKIAIRILQFSYPLYRMIWLRHQDRLMGR